RRMKRAVLASIAVLLALQTSGVAAVRAQGGKTIAIKILSTRPDRVSGGDALVAILPSAPTKDRPVVILNGRDVSGDFHSQHDMFVGLVTGLTIGKNELTARMSGVPEQRLHVTNYSTTGPIISGPHQQP